MANSWQARLLVPGKFVYDFTNLHPAIPRSWDDVDGSGDRYVPNLQVGKCRFSRDAPTRTATESLPLR
jgi:hypothetical protein